METEDIIPQQNQEPEVEIYSKRAIWWFSIFSPLFGAILLMINMWNAGYKSEIIKIIAFLIAWALLDNVIISYVPANPKMLALILIITISIIFTIAAAAILAGYYFVKYFPEKDYYPKSIEIPLFIMLIITVPPVVFTIMRMGVLK